MCGIIAAIAQRDIAPILLEGLRRLEYRGYDSAGIGVIDRQQKLRRVRKTGKVQVLANALSKKPMLGELGVAHTRWATHGKPSERNAHPQVSGTVALVHNGIIENHEALRTELKADGYSFSSDTDTEVIAHLVARALKKGLSSSKVLSFITKKLKGAYALAIINSEKPDEMLATCMGSPLVIGLGFGEHYVASDIAALLPVTRRFIYLEDGDMCVLRREKINLYAANGKAVKRAIQESKTDDPISEKGPFRHFMLKEIYDQSESIANILEGRFLANTLAPNIFGPQSDAAFAKIKAVQIVACGTSYHAAMVARYWIESICNIACFVDIASEWRYRKAFVPEKCLFIALSQSGETADTLAALRIAKEQLFSKTLAICNVAHSTLVRECDFAFMMRAGPEVGVASTKAFTSQLASLLLLVLAFQKALPKSARPICETITQALHKLPQYVSDALKLAPQIEQLAEDFSQFRHALFLGRGSLYPIAMEGALKLKEISYLHAEAYAAGELKHGPLALIDENMPVIVLAPHNALWHKIQSNMQEVRARGGRLYVFSDNKTALRGEEGMEILRIKAVPELIAPIVYSIPLQLFAYYVAIIKGTDVDQPRNLAKSVTVE